MITVFKYLDTDSLHSRSECGCLFEWIELGLNHKKYGTDLMEVDGVWPYMKTDLIVDVCMPEILFVKLGIPDPYTYKFL